MNATKIRSPNLLNWALEYSDKILYYYNNKYWMIHDKDTWLICRSKIDSYGLGDWAAAATIYDEK